MVLDMTVFGFIERRQWLTVIVSNNHFSQINRNRHQVQEEMKKGNSSSHLLQGWGSVKE